MCLNLAGFRATDSARFTHSHATLTLRIVDKPIKTLSKHPVVL